MNTLIPLTQRGDMELCRILSEVNVCGYTIVTERTSVRLFVTIHRGPLQTEEVEYSVDYLIEPNRLKDNLTFINWIILPQFLGLNYKSQHRAYREQTHDAFISPYIKSKTELTIKTASRIRSQFGVINKKVMPRIIAMRVDLHKTNIRSDILSACRRTKQDPVKFMQAMLNEFIVEETLKS